MISCRAARRLETRMIGMGGYLALVRRFAAVLQTDQECQHAVKRYTLQLQPVQHGDMAPAGKTKKIRDG